MVLAEVSATESGMRSIRGGCDLQIVSRTQYTWPHLCMHLHCAPITLTCSCFTLCPVALATDNQDICIPYMSKPLVVKPFVDTQL